ncbi:predicted protein [Botrytis cinerea T4]|uniref:Uncharacterized protein n=1 Tax=Botryotinia fuckeliana (strain T4) TaxID=999810 RepID=G2Y9Z3_BOTF4|nr:predicted protein [Botrytis cinerea T4]
MRPSKPSQPSKPPFKIRINPYTCLGPEPIFAFG